MGLAERKRCDICSEGGYVGTEDNVSVQTCCEQSKGRLEELS